MHIIICVDDTDDLTKRTSTGAVAERIAYEVVSSGGRIDLEITRHQLLLDERIPYTSHNSSMAFSAHIPVETFDGIYRSAIKAIYEMMAPGSDPGLCIAIVPEDDDDTVHQVVAFGQRAKREVLSMDDAFCLASQIPWLILNELGGTGQGVIGALAGVGLRLSGCDGRFRGKWDLVDLCYGAATNVVYDNRGAALAAAKTRASMDQAAMLVLPVAEVIGKLHEFVEGEVRVLDSQGAVLAPEVPLAIEHEVKPIYHAGTLAIVVEVHDDIAWPCSKADLEELHGGFRDMDRSCDRFEFDNDMEELLAYDETRSCPNCLYRRWVAGGFTCMKASVLSECCV